MRRSRPIAVVTWVWSSFLIKQKHLRFDLRKGEFLKCCFLFFSIWNFRLTSLNLVLERFISYVKNKILSGIYKKSFFLLRVIFLHDHPQIFFQNV